MSLIFSRNSLIIFVLFCSLPSVGGAQGEDQLAGADDPALVLGLKLQSTGRFYDAITEYKRCFFFNEKKEERNRALLGIGLCYAELEQWTDSTKALAQSLKYCTGEMESETRVLLIAQVRIAARAYDRAELELLELFRFSRYEAIARKAAFYIGVSSVYRYDWEKAKEYLLQAHDPGVPLEKTKMEKVEAILSDHDPADYRSADLAGVLSAVIPGLGQLYAGKPGDGGMAFIINCGVAAWTGFLVAGGDWTDAIMVVNFIFLRFYLGNITNARKYAAGHNERVNLEKAAGVIAILMAE